MQFVLLSELFTTYEFNKVGNVCGVYTSGALLCYCSYKVSSYLNKRYKLIMFNSCIYACMDNCFFALRQNLRDSSVSLYF